MSDHQEPPCPHCGRHYDRFVWNRNVDNTTNDPPEGDDICETGLGWYVHDE